MGRGVWASVQGHEGEGADAQDGFGLVAALHLDYGEALAVFDYGGFGDDVGYAKARTEVTERAVDGCYWRAEADGSSAGSNICCGVETAAVGGIYGIEVVLGNVHLGDGVAFLHVSQRQANIARKSIGRISFFHYLLKTSFFHIRNLVK